MRPCSFSQSLSEATRKMNRRPVARQNQAGDAGKGARGRLVVNVGVRGHQRGQQASCPRMEEAQARDAAVARLCAAIAVMPSSTRRWPWPSSCTIIETSWPRSRQARASNTCWIVSPPMYLGFAFARQHAVRIEADDADRRALMSAPGAEPSHTDRVVDCGHDAGAYVRGARHRHRRRLALHHAPGA